MSQPEVKLNVSASAADVGTVNTIQAAPVVAAVGVVQPPNPVVAPTVVPVNPPPTPVAGVADVKQPPPAPLVNGVDIGGIPAIPVLPSGAASASVPPPPTGPSMVNIPGIGTFVSGSGQIYTHHAASSAAATIKELTERISALQLEAKQSGASQAELNREIFAYSRKTCKCKTSRCLANRCSCRTYSKELGKFVGCDEDCFCVLNGGCLRNPEKEKREIIAYQKKLSFHSKLAGSS